MSMRLLPVPDGFDGERVDTALARMTGLSRSRVEDLCEAGEVRRGGETLAKSSRLRAGELLEVDLPDPRPVEPVATPVEGMELLYEDEDIVVVDKPAGVAAHPSMGWDGPDVLGALKAMHVRVATSGAAERQGIVSRLDVGTSGVMIVAKGEQAYSVLKRAFREHTVDKVYRMIAESTLKRRVGPLPLGHDHGTGRAHIQARDDALALGRARGRHRHPHRLEGAQYIRTIPTHRGMGSHTGGFVHDDNVLILIEQPHALHRRGHGLGGLGGRQVRLDHGARSHPIGLADRHAIKTDGAQ